MGASKEDLINAVIREAKDYYMNDVDGIIMKMQKEKKVKLSKLEKRIEFLNNMETAIRNKLNETNNWGHEETYSLFQTYLIYVPDLLGKEFMIPGFGQPNTGHNKKAQVTIGFTKNRLSTIHATMATIKDYNIQNGYGYTDATLAEISRVTRSNFGEFSHERRQWSWNMCSDRQEPVYYEKFNLKGGNITGYLEAEFGIYIYQLNKTKCQYRGNQLTSVSFYLYSNG
jgi:hypothetical protein